MMANRKCGKTDTTVKSYNPEMSLLTCGAEERIETAYLVI